MILPLCLFTLAFAETADTEKSRLFIERDVLVQRIAEIDKRLDELGVAVPSAVPVAIPVYTPGFKAVKVDSFKGSEKVAGVLASHQEEFAACWAIVEHATAVSFWVDGTGRFSYEPPSIFWSAAGGRGQFEDPVVRDCYRGVIMTIWDFPPALLTEEQRRAPVEEWGDKPQATPYQVEFIFG